MTEERKPSDYGVLEREQVEGDLAVHAERIRVAGYSVVADAFTADEAASIPFGDALSVSSDIGFPF